ncbi:MAG TPA: Zn-dependent hydrolase [Thermoplasmatales archaeon]|nr:Zn-dependent hydrolase [Thermoplasmatales archaeon]
MIRIRWHGHACFEISNEKNVVIDPHDGISIGIPPPKTKADLILITHEHYDHNKSRVVEKEGSIIVKENRKINGIEIETFSAYHDKFGGERRGEIKIFKINFEGIKFCHLGDLGHILEEETVRKIGEIDILFIPVGGVFTIDAREAIETCKKIDAKVIIPMHYKIEGLSLRIDGIEPFIDLSPYEVRYIGNEIEMDSEDIPKEKEIWIFSL